MKVVIIGGVAAGATFAARLRRLDKDVQIVILEKGKYVSYANCGLPYYVSGEIPTKNQLLLMTPKMFHDRFDIDVRIQHEVIKIDSAHQCVVVKNHQSDESYKENYDKLVIATGSSPLQLSIPGISHPHIYQLWTFEDFERIKAEVKQHDIKTACIIGGGFVGIETAENLRQLGVDTDIVEMGKQVLNNIDFEMIQPIHKKLVEQGVHLHLQTELKAFESCHDQVKVITSRFEKVYDIQRLATRMSNGSASPRDFLSLRDSLFVLPEILDISKELTYNPFLNVETYRDDIADFAALIERTIKEDPPIQLKEGGIIKSSVSGELDYYRDLLTGGEDWLVKYAEEEREKTGIKNLKVSFNKVLGYFIEVTNSNLNLVPPNYVRKQTIANGERFITDELKKHEDDVLSAKFKSTELEYRLFSDFREYSKEFVSKVREIADCIASLDVYSSLAEVASENNYCRPELDESGDFVVKNGRHPVLEKILPLGEYVSNDLDLKSNSSNSTQFMILTGPNMAGKSTYMRQNALIVLLAQIGSWVPADYVKLGVVDKIFTRVGASDDLTLGQSTFMVEMVETSYILNSATEKSFILLDEIGRGTSTYDGVAIAWAVAEYIATKIKARCIFATHYHELNVMTETYPQIKNFRITVAEENGEIQFLRKIVQGGASKSYGIQVAKMAGLPASVVKRSQDLMSRMQKDYSNNLATRKKSSDIPQVDVPQLNLFTSN